MARDERYTFNRRLTWEQFVQNPANSYVKRFGYAVRHDPVDHVFASIWQDQVRPTAPTVIAEAAAAIQQIEPACTPTALAITAVDAEDNRSPASPPRSAPSGNGPPRFPQSICFPISSRSRKVREPQSKEHTMSQIPVRQALSGSGFQWPHLAFEIVDDKGVSPDGFEAVSAAPHHITMPSPMSSDWPITNSVTLI